MREPTTLTEATVHRATDETRIARGEDYVQYVRGVRVVGDRAFATVQAKRVYRVELDWTGALAGTCTCVDYGEGYFCKHLVAVALAVIDAAEPSEPAPINALTSFLTELTHEQLVELVTDLVDRDPEARTRVLARAAATGRTDALDPADLVSQVNHSLRSRGFVDYRRSFEVARDAQDVLDRLQELLDFGAADAVRLHCSGR